MKIVLAYSGGLDTSAIIPWLKDNYKDAQIYAFVANVGQGKDELAGIEQKALASGALACEIAQLEQEFVKDYIYPCAHASTVYEGAYLLGTAMARPVIAKAMVAYAKKIGAQAIAHGATGKGNDQVRFEYAIAALAPELKIIAPWRVWDFKGRQDLLDYLASKNIPTTASAEKIYSKDANLWHVSCEGGLLEDTANAPNENCFSADVMQTPNEPEDIVLELEGGYLKSINGEHLDLVSSLKKLNELGNKHAIGQLDMVENRLVGLKSRGCYETPGGVILQAAINALAQLVYDRDSLKLRSQLAHELAYLVYDGKWFSPARAAISAAISTLAPSLSGSVKIRLYKANATVLSKTSPNSLYDANIASFENSDEYDQLDAKGFIKLFSLSAKIRAKKGLYEQF